MNVRTALWIWYWMGRRRSGDFLPTIDRPNVVLSIDVGSGKTNHKINSRIEKNFVPYPITSSSQSYKTSHCRKRLIKAVKMMYSTIRSQAFTRRILNAARSNEKQMLSASLTARHMSSSSNTDEWATASASSPCRLF